MLEIIRLHEPIVDAAWGELVGLTPQAAFEMRRTLGLDERATLAELLLAYCGRIRAQASGHTGELAQERARLARAQTEKVEMQNAVARRGLAPVVVLETALAGLAQQIAAILEAIRVQLKGGVANITREELQDVEREIVAARNL